MPVVSVPRFVWCLFQHSMPSRKLFLLSVLTFSTVTVDCLGVCQAIVLVCKHRKKWPLFHPYQIIANFSSKYFILSKVYTDEGGKSNTYIKVGLSVQEIIHSLIKLMNDPCTGGLTVVKLLLITPFIENTYNDRTPRKQ